MGNNFDPQDLRIILGITRHFTKEDFALYIALRLVQIRFTPTDKDTLSIMKNLNIEIDGNHSSS